MKREQLYFFALICYSVVSGLLMVRLFDSIQENDEPKILGAGILLFISLIAFVCFAVLSKRQSKKENH